MGRPRRERNELPIFTPSVGTKTAALVGNFIAGLSSIFYPPALFFLEKSGAHCIINRFLVESSYNKKCFEILIRNYALAAGNSQKRVYF